MGVVLGLWPLQAGGMLQLLHFQGEWLTLVEPHSKDLLPQNILSSKLMRSQNPLTYELF